MDIQRIFILLGLAVTAYMLILAWNEDYGQGARSATGQDITVTDSAPVDASASVPTLEAPTPGESVVPELAVPKIEAAPATTRSPETCLTTLRCTGVTSRVRNRRT